MDALFLKGLLPPRKTEELSPDPENSQVAVLSVAVLRPSLIWAPKLHQEQVLGEAISPRNEKSASHEGQCIGSASSSS